MTDPQQLPLRDIHLPASVSWWPPAPGWWALTLIILVAALLSWWGYRRLRQRRFSAYNMARRALLEVRQQYADHGDVLAMIRELSVLLRRVTISAYPRDEAASLTGVAWLQFLDKPLGATPFATGAGRILLDAPYRRAVTAAEVEPLFQLCEAWLDAVEKGQGAGR